MSTIYDKTDNYSLNLYGDNDPADLRDGYNGSMRTIDSTLETHLNRIEGVESRETHDGEVAKALLGDNTVDNATTAKTKWDKASADAAEASSRLESMGVVDTVTGADLKNSVSRVNDFLHNYTNYTMTFDTVAAMRESAILSDGMKCRTLGFYGSGDGGGAYYTINANTNDDVANNMDTIFCKNGLIAKLVVDNNFINVRQYGAHGDGVSDDTNVLSYVMHKRRSVIYIPGGQYVCHASINVGWNSSVIGDELTNSSINDAGTCLLMYNIPDTTNHTPSALIIDEFNTLKNLYIKGNQWSMAENRNALNPSAPDKGQWMTQTALDETVKTCGIESNTVGYLQNIVVDGFETGFKLSSQGNATQLMARNCVLGYNISGDMRATSLQASSCMQGFFFGGGNVECSHLRCDGIFSVGYSLYYGGSFVDLSGDFIGDQMLKCSYFNGVIQDVRAARCCVNYASESPETTNTAQAYGVQLISPKTCIISGLLVSGGGSVADSPSDSIYRLKSPGNGVIVSQVQNMTNFTIDCESNMVLPQKTDAYTTDEIQKILYINPDAPTEEKNNTYGRVRFRNSIIKVTAGVVTVQ